MHTPLRLSVVAASAGMTRESIFDQPKEAFSKLIYIAYLHDN